MKIKNAGYNYRHEKGFVIDRPCGSGDYLLLIIRSDAFAFLDGKRIPIPTNSALLYQKGTPQLYGSTEGEFINDWIHFEPEHEDALLSLGIPFNTVIPLGDAIKFSHYIKNIFVEKHSQNLHREETMSLLLQLILLKLSEKITLGDPKSMHPSYPAFCELRHEIQLSPQNKWSIDLICKKMMLSRSYVQHLYKQFFGVSILSDIQSCRIEYAKLLLSSTNIKVSVISQLCGYDSDVHFMRVFKTVTAVTPTDFRNHF